MRIIHIRLQSIGKIVFNCCTYVLRLNSHFWHNIFLLTKIKKIFPLTCIFPLMWKYVRALFYYFVRWIGFNYYFFHRYLKFINQVLKRRNTFMLLWHTLHWSPNCLLRRCDYFQDYWSQRFIINWQWPFNTYIYVWF